MVESFTNHVDSKKLKSCQIVDSLKGCILRAVLFILYLEDIQIGMGEKRSEC